jgi:ComF family protein
MLSDALLEYYPASIIVPVPGRRIVKKSKGWEHIDLIGKILKHKYKLPVYKLLIRKGKKAQKTLSREKRAENLRKSIRIQKNIKNIPASVVLLDDVFTTGTTINECAGILKSAGVEKIYSLTIAID